MLAPAIRPSSAPTAREDSLGFTSLHAETTVAALAVEGSLPAWLQGTLLRNGPARFEVGSEPYRHWFDGLAMIHRFTIADNNVSYANRYLRSAAYVEAERTGRIPFSEFATNPKRSPLERLNDFMRRRSNASNNANVNVVPFGTEYLALTETPAPVAFHPTTLETRATLAYDDAVPGQMTTAHTHYDRERRATFNIVTEIGRASRYQVVRIADGTLRREAIASIPTDLPGYIHAFSTTERYVIVIEYPLVVRPLDLLLSRKPFIDNYRWEPQRGTRIHVIAKDGGAWAGTYESDAFFAFHHINAFEEGDTVVIDIAAYSDATIIGDFMLDHLRSTGARQIASAEFRRLRLIPGKTAAHVERLVPEATELPCIAHALAGKPYTYAYGVNAGAASAGAFADEIVKVDINNRSVLRWSAPNSFPGEPIFVARPGAIDEDDGVLLSVVLDAVKQHSYVLVLDARTLGEQARVIAPHHIPFGFHGMFSMK